MLSGKTILIFGGSGSLGNALVQRYYKSNQIIIFSRDECKHWKMSLKYDPKFPIQYVIGDIRDYQRVESAISRTRPDIIIVASALKHIDRCEYAVEECIQTNYNGILNVTNVVEKLNSPIVVLYVSTDKACSPVNSYGISKAMGEKVMIEKAFYSNQKFDIENNIQSKFVTVRYGNVLNSNGSLIQILHTKGKDPNVKEFTLTHSSMTRFIQTLEQSVDLIEHAILNAQNGDIVIPKIKSANISDLIDIFSEIYNKPSRTTGLRFGEKLYETLINTTQFMSVTEDTSYYYIKPSFYNTINNPTNNLIHPDYDSNNCERMNKTELKNYLNELGLLSS